MTTEELPIVSMQDLEQLPECDVTESDIPTEEELQELINLLKSEVVPVRSQEGIDQLLQLIRTLTDVTNAVFADKKFGQEDFLVLQPLWDDAWKTLGMIAEIEKEVKDLGFIGKAIAGLKAYSVISKLLKAIKAAKVV